MRDIVGFEGLYSITEDGEVWSHRNDKYISQSNSTRSKYMYVQLWRNNKGYHKSVHRLVAEAYVDNPDNLPEVDHIDDNHLNNYYSNLQWITRKGNLEKSFKRFSPVRNFLKCSLFRDSQLIAQFESITACCKHCEREHGLSYSMLSKHKAHRNYVIKCND